MSLEGKVLEDLIGRVKDLEEIQEGSTVTPALLENIGNLGIAVNSMLQILIEKKLTTVDEFRAMTVKVAQEMMRGAQPRRPVPVEETKKPDGEAKVDKETEDLSEESPQLSP